MIQYAKQNPTLVGFKRTCHLALEVVKKLLINEEQAPLIHYQHTETKAVVIGAWGQCYQESSCQSQAYDSALVVPPDGRAHMVVQITSTGLKEKGHTFSHRIPCTIQSTLTCLITGHAFTGAY